MYSYNVTRDQSCYKLELTGPAGGPGVQTFLYQFCTDAVAQELPFFPANGETDMFWDQGPYNQVGGWAGKQAGGLVDGQAVKRGWRTGQVAGCSIPLCCA